MVDQEFLFDTLAARSFGLKWISWIRNILETSKVNILINSSSSGYVRYKRGLREGDLLSPLLFVLVADALSAMCSHALTSKILYRVLLNFHNIICNLQLADDHLLITTRGIEDLRILKIILFLFEGLSGLTVNFQKSYLYSTTRGATLLLVTKPQC